jgi:amidase
MQSMACKPPFQITNWRAAAARARSALHASIPSEWKLPEALAEQVSKDELLPSDPVILKCGILSALDIEITTITDVPVLLDRIARKMYSACQVAEAFCKRAAIVQQCTGCLSELMVERAMERAAGLDAFLTREGRTIGLLHGLPVSMKV